MSIFRLYVLRVTYLLIVVGVGAMIWPLLLDAPETVDHFRGVTWCLLEHSRIARSPRSALSGEDDPAAPLRVGVEGDLASNNRTSAGKRRPT